MNNSMSCSGGRWCTRADLLLGVEGVHISAVIGAGTGLLLHVETGEDLTGCPDCRVVAIGHGRCQVRLHAIPYSAGQCSCSGPSPVWRCPDDDCLRTTFTEEHQLAGPRSKLTARAARWAIDGLQRFDTSVSALAHQLGASWHTALDAIRAEAIRRIGIPERLSGVNALGVDEHVWSHIGPPGSGVVTGIVDHTRDAKGGMHARLLDPFRAGRGRLTLTGSRTEALGSPRVSRPRRWTRFAATPTLSATRCPKRSPSWTRSTA